MRKSGGGGRIETGTYLGLGVSTLNINGIRDLNYFNI